MKTRNSLLKHLFLFIPGFLLLGQLATFPCTVAVVSGKATRDGRPLMWKNRDTSSLDNKMIYFQGEKYDFIGLIDAEDKKVENVWAGINTAGFAIMNAASGDLAEGPNGMMNNGRFMKRALAECANVSDFEDLLNRTNGNRSVGANFGIIDAEGNACIYETSNSTFQKFDSNDPEVTPQGYIIRTNYAFTSPVKDGGGGYIRFERASRLFEAASAERRLDCKFILQEAARDLANEKLNSFPLTDSRVYDSNSAVYINTDDTINRNSTASVALFHGVSNPQEARLATMWILLGQPVCSVAVPLWANAASVPEILSGPETAPLNDLSRALASYLYPDKKGHLNRYLNLSRLIRYGGEGVLSRLFKIENQVFAETEMKLNEWEKKKPAKQDVADFEEKMATWVYKSLKSSFPDIKIAE
jgi:hypothetical protein